MHETRINLGEYPELSASLHGEARPETLYTSCQRLLANCGMESTIDMLPATVTRWYAETELTGQPLYARVGKLSSKRGEEHLPVIVFDETSDLPVETGNYLALAFQKFGDKVSLQTQNSINPLIDDPRYLALAQKVVRGIALQDMQEREAAKDKWADRVETVTRLGRQAYAYLTDNTQEYNRTLREYSTRGARRRFRLGVSTAAMMLGYGHVLTGDVDAKLGPVPLPQPIEMFVDMANQEDHAAQGFREPKGAAALKVGEQDRQLPLIDTYDVQGVPDATDETGYGAGRRLPEVSRPGLYKVNYLSRFRNPPEAVNAAKDPYCFTVYGNFRNGKSSAFTQDTDAAANLRIEVRNAEELEACIADGGNAEIKGSFYIWQDK